MRAILDSLRSPKAAAPSFTPDAIILQRAHQQSPAKAAFHWCHGPPLGRRDWRSRLRNRKSTPSSLFLIPPSGSNFPLGKVCRLLNTIAVDDRFRRMSGSVSVSTKALQAIFSAACCGETCGGFFNARKRSDDDAADAAYAASTERSPSTKKKKAAQARKRRGPS